MQREHAALFRSFAGLDYRDKGAILEFVSDNGLLGVEPQEQGPFSADYGRHYAFGESHLTWVYEISLMHQAVRLADLRSVRKGDREKLTWLIDLHLQRVQPRMVFEPDTPPRLSFAPLDLLASMWLQLALSVAGDKEFRQCKFCRRLFEISTEQSGFRRHREFCSDPSCKTNDYRRRKRMALELAEKGLSLSTIAQRIETQKATVRTWLAASGQHRRGKK